MRLRIFDQPGKEFVVEELLMLGSAMSVATVVKHERDREEVGSRKEIRTMFGVRLLVVAIFCVGSAFSQDKVARVAAQRPAGTIYENAGTAAVASRVPVRSGARASVESDTPVVTVAGVCDPSQKSKGTRGCKTVVTRAEVDALVGALEPNALPAARRQFAINYSRLVAAAGEAVRRNLERDPAVAQQIQAQQKLVRMQLLANTLYRQMEAQANNVPAADIEKYYAEHHENFAQGELRRLYVPKTISALSGQSPDLAILRAKADDVRARATTGEDFDALQLEIFKDLGIRTATPPTKLSLMSRMKLPLAERPVFELDPGQVTAVIDTPSAFVVSKLESKNTIPIASARAEIVTILQRDRQRQEIREVMESGKTEFNLKYLDLPSAPDFLPPPQIAGLSAEQGAQSTLAQRVPMRRPTVSRRREVTAFPTPQR